MADHWSVSALDDFTRCGEAFRLKRIVKVETRPTVWLPGGSAFHKTAERFDLDAYYAGVELGSEAEGVKWASENHDWDEQFRIDFLHEVRELHRKVKTPIKEWRAAGRVSKDKPNKEDARWWLAEGQRMVRRYIKWRLDNPHFEVAVLPDNEGPAVEKRLRFRLGDVEIINIPDLVMVDTRVGQYLIVDRKTGTREPKKIIQLQTGAAALKAAYGWIIEYGCYYMSRTGSFSLPSYLTRLSEASMIQLYEMADRAKRAGLFLPHLSDDCSSFCEVQRFCKFAGGTPHPNDIPEDEGKQAA